MCIHEVKVREANNLFLRGLKPRKATELRGLKPRKATELRGLKPRKATEFARPQAALSSDV
jgi:hypothetical protein